MLDQSLFPEKSARSSRNRVHLRYTFLFLFVCGEKGPIEKHLGMNHEKRPFFDVRQCLKEWKPDIVPVSSPVEVACFSRLSSTQYIPCSRQSLKSFRFPQVPSCLSQGCDSFIPKDESSSISLTPVRESLEKANVPLDASILTFRNNLNKIAATPYQVDKAWKVASHLEGSLVVLDIIPDGSRQPVTYRDRYFEFCGYKFEQLCCDDNVVVDANQEFCSIVKTSIGRHTLLISAQVDCWDSRGLCSCSSRLAYPICHYVELKSMKKQTAANATKSMVRSLHHKYLRFWIQSFLAGVPHLFIGYRDDRREMLVDTEYIPVCRLPEMCGYSWDPNVCLGFLDSFLHFVSTMQRTFPSTPIVWEYEPNAQKVFISL